MYAMSNLYYIPTRKYEILSDDMILIDFMSEDMCQKMISLAEDRTFNVMEGDVVPSQDLRLKADWRVGKT